MSNKTRFTIRSSFAIWLGCLSNFVAIAQETPGPAAFKRLDKNNDGNLTRDELPAVLFDRLDNAEDGAATEGELKALR